MKILLAKPLIYLLLFALFISACTPQSELVEQMATTSTDSLTVAPTIMISPTKAPVADVALPDVLPAGIQIKFWHPWSGEMANLVVEMVAEFNETNKWGIIVKVEFHSDENVFIDDVNQAFITGMPPEVMAAPSYYLQFLEEKGVSLQNLDDFIKSLAWGYTADERSSFLPVFWNSDINGEKRLGVPAYRSAYLIFYNLTWARDLGFLKSPANPEEFKAQTCSAGLSYLNDHDLNNDGTGGWVYSYDPYAFYSWLNAFGGGINQGGNPFSLGENTTASSYLYELFLYDCAWIGRQQQPYEYFANRQALAYSGKMEDILTQERVNSLNNANDFWSVLPYPSTASPQLLVDGDSYVIVTKDQEKALAAWIFIQWMLNPENQVRIIETTGTFPLSSTAMSMLNDYKIQHPVWAAALQYLPILQNAPLISNWGTVKKIFADISWKLIQYTTVKDDIPIIFQDAQSLLAEQSK